MLPFLISLVVTAGHFFLLTYIWFEAGRFFPEFVNLVLLGYLVIGPLPYLLPAYLRLRRFDTPSLLFVYVLGSGLLLLTLGFVWRFRTEVLKIGLPMVVTHPASMTILVWGYIVTAAFLSYLIVLVSGSFARNRASQALLARPPLRLPLLRKETASGQERSGSIAQPSESTSLNPEEPILSRAGASPGESGPSRAPATMVSAASSLPTEPTRRLNPLTPDELTKLKQIQQAFSNLTGLSLFTYDSGGTPLVEPSSENPICRLVQTTSKGSQHCRAHCGKSINMALETGEPVFFKCDAGLHVFSVPAIINKEDPKSHLVFLGGKTFFDRGEFTVCRQGARALDVPEDELSGLSDRMRVLDDHTMIAAARLVERTLPPLVRCGSEKNLAASQFARAMSLFTVLFEMKQDRPLNELAPSLLGTLGVLFDIETAAILTLDPQDGRFKTLSAYGKKAGPLDDFSTESTAGLFGLLQETGKPLSSRETMEILKTGLPPEISSVRLFPLLLRSKQIAGVLAIMDTPLTEDDATVVSVFCRQVALHEENRNLSSERQDLSKDVSVLMEIAKTVGSALESDDLFWIILDKSTEFLKAEQGSLMLLDDERKELTIKAMKGLNKKIVELLKIRPGEGISGKVLSTGTPLLVSDIERDSRVGQEKRSRYRTKSFISVPLKLNGLAIGVMNVADKATGEVFTQEDLHLLLSICAYATMAIDRSKFYHKTEELKKISITDSLTGLLNRRYFQERMSEEIERSRRHHLPLSLVIIDLDDFKTVNDTYGHMIGDEVLKVTARCLRNCIRAIDVAARYGGEEFTIILPQTSKTDATVIAERICHEVRKLDFPFKESGQRIPLSVSLGLATYPDDADDLETLIRNADIALYQAKAQGKNRMVSYQKQ